MEATRIAQLTDIHHLRNKGDTILGVDPEESLKAIIANLMSLHRRPDAPIATGDLADDGSTAAYGRLKALFEELRIPVYVLPGNHDHIENMQSSLVSRSIHMEDTASLNGWSLVFVNSQVANEDYGCVSPEGLAKLKTGIESSEGRSCLVALHHSPTPECTSSGCQLTNSQELLNIVANYGVVKGVISGHTHHCTERTSFGAKLLTTPSTFLHVEHTTDKTAHPSDFEKLHQFDASRRGYRILDLYDDGEIESKIQWV